MGNWLLVCGKHRILFGVDDAADVIADASALASGVDQFFVRAKSDYFAEIEGYILCQTHESHQITGL